MKATMPDSEFTEVATGSCPRQYNYRILFGKPRKIAIQNIGQDESSWAFFSAGQIFALDLWRCNRYGTIEWAVYVLQSARPGEVIVPVPQVTPGAKVLLEAHGKKQAQAALKELAEIQARIDPTTLPAARFLLTDFRLKAATRCRRPGF
jgi:hypothetical protein